MELRIRDNHFVLLHQKAVYWREAETLLIADLHLGKIMHFRRHGIAVPDAAVGDNFYRLDELIDQHRPRRIIFLGDLFHNRHNTEWEMFASWRDHYAYIEMLIVMGNHDILPLRLFAESSIHAVRCDYIEGPFIFTHHPRTHHPDDSAFVFAGHIHPVFALTAKARQSFRLPCFLYDRCQMVLPSFGVFTGGYEISEMPHLNIFIVADKRVFAVRE
jgi:DNA ligase-associated metallophosphoesterase